MGVVRLWALPQTLHLKIQTKQALISLFPSLYAYFELTLASTYVWITLLVYQSSAVQGHPAQYAVLLLFITIKSLEVPFAFSISACFIDEMNTPKEKLYSMCLVLCYFLCFQNPCNANEPTVL